MEIPEAAHSLTAIRVVVHVESRRSVSGFWEVRKYSRAPRAHPLPFYGDVALDEFRASVYPARRCLRGVRSVVVEEWKKPVPIAMAGHQAAAGKIWRAATARR